MSVYEEARRWNAQLKKFTNISAAQAEKRRKFYSERRTNQLRRCVITGTAIKPKVDPAAHAAAESGAGFTRHVGEMIERFDCRSLLDHLPEDAPPSSDLVSSDIGLSPQLSAAISFERYRPLIEAKRAGLPEEEHLRKVREQIDRILQEERAREEMERRGPSNNSSSDSGASAADPNSPHFAGLEDDDDEGEEDGDNSDDDDEAPHGSGSNSLPLSWAASSSSSSSSSASAPIPSLLPGVAAVDVDVVDDARARGWQQQQQQQQAYSSHSTGHGSGAAGLVVPIPSHLSALALECGITSSPGDAFVAGQLYSHLCHLESTVQTVHLERAEACRRAVDKAERRAKARGRSGLSLARIQSLTARAATRYEATHRHRYVPAALPSETHRASGAAAAGYPAKRSRWDGSGATAASSASSSRKSSSDRGAKLFISSFGDDDEEDHNGEDGGTSSSGQESKGAFAQSQPVTSPVLPLDVIRDFFPEVVPVAPSSTSHPASSSSGTASVADAGYDEDEDHVQDCPTHVKSVLLFARGDSCDQAPLSAEGRSIYETMGGDLGKTASSLSVNCHKDRARVPLFMGLVHIL